MHIYIYIHTITHTDTCTTALTFKFTYILTYLLTYTHTHTHTHTPASYLQVDLIIFTFICLFIHFICCTLPPSSSPLSQSFPQPFLLWAGGDPTGISSPCISSLCDHILCYWGQTHQSRWMGWGGRGHIQKDAESWGKRCPWINGCFLSWESQPQWYEPEEASSCSQRATKMEW